MNEKKTEPIQVRAEPQFKALAESMAASYGLSTSAYIRMLITRDAEKYKGINLQPAVVAETEVIAE